jgi:hypothetical protein
MARSRYLRLCHQLNYARIWCLIRVIDRNLGSPLNPILNRVCEMRDYLHRPAKIVPLSLSFNDMLIDLSSRHVVFACQGDIEVPFVVSKLTPRHAYRATPIS